jgi:type IV pilus assembly protein PilF
MAVKTDQIKAKTIKKLVLYVTTFSTLLLSLGCVTSASSNNSKRAAELKMEIGISHIERNNLPLALKELLGAEELDKKNYLVQNSLGLVYFLRDKLDLSAQHYKQATILNPQFTDAKNNLARVFIEQKKYTKAAPLLDDVLADLTYTNAYTAHFNYGLLYFNQNMFDLAKPYFLRVLNDNREDCYTQVYYSRCLMETRNIQLALNQLNKAVPFCTNNKIDDAQYFLAIAYYRLADRQKSLEKFSELIKLFPDGKHHGQAAQMIDLIQKEKK